MEKQIKGDYGVIEYRFPDVPEGLELLGELGVDKAEVEEIQKAKAENRPPKVNLLKRSARAIRFLGPFCTKLELETNDGIKVTEYDKAIKHLEFCLPLTELAAHILGALDIAPKKKPRSKPSASSSPKKQLPLKVSKD